MVSELVLQHVDVALHVEGNGVWLGAEPSGHTTKIPTTWASYRAAVLGQEGARHQIIVGLL